jgi:hypothetical protein
LRFVCYILGLTLLPCNRRALVEQGNERHVRVWLDSLKMELRGVLGEVALYELLFQLMSHPVPNTVKAAIDEVRARTVLQQYTLGCTAGRYCSCGALGLPWAAV